MNTSNKKKVYFYSLKWITTEFQKTQA